ncbi:MAG: DegV family EDD domain-containing protein [Lachnospiraceae bacterium]|nr:DegV family EDD domain-containing protein [Lachnospiraceae bacterium]
MKISIDSASNYRKIEGIDYSIAPLSINTNEREFIDDESFNVNEMLDYLEHTKLSSRSACPGINDWYKTYGDEKEVIVIALASALSGSYNSAKTAADEWLENHPDSKIFLLDTTAIGPVEKLCVEYIIENKDKMSFEELTKSLDEYCHKNTKIGFCLKSLKNLANNGRINPAVAKIAETLKIHIVGDFTVEGILDPKDKVRGGKKAMETLYKNMLDAGYKGGKLRIDHVLAPESANELANIVRADFPQADIIIDDTTALCSFYAQRGGLVIGYER